MKWCRTRSCSRCVFEGVTAFNADYLAQMMAIPKNSVLNTVAVSEKFVKLKNYTWIRAISAWPPSAIFSFRRKVLTVKSMKELSRISS